MENACRFMDAFLPTEHHRASRPGDVIQAILSSTINSNEALATTNIGRARTNLGIQDKSTTLANYKNS